MAAPKMRLNLSSKISGTHQAGPWMTKKAKAINKGKAAAAKKNANRNAGRIAVDPQTALMNVIQDFQKTVLTPQQEMKRIKQGIGFQLGAERRALASAAAEEKAASIQQAARARQFAEAVGSLEQQEGGLVQADYRQAARDIAGFGTGLTGEVAAAHEAAARETAADIGQVTGGVGQMTKGFDIPGLRNIAQYTGVTMPADTLAEEAANQAAGARLRSRANMAHIGNMARDLDRKTGEIAAKLRRDKAALEAKRPGLFFEAMQQLENNRIQTMATLVSAFGLANTQTATAADIEQGKAQTSLEWWKAQVEKYKAQTERGKLKGRDPDTGELLAGFYAPYGPKGQAVPVPEGFIRSPKDPTKLKALPVPPEAPEPGKTGGLTASQVQTVINNTMGRVEDVLLKPPYTKIKPGSQFNPSGEEYLPTLSRSAALTKLLTYFPSGLRKNPQVRAALNDALSGVGYR